MGEKILRCEANLSGHKNLSQQVSLSVSHHLLHCVTSEPSSISFLPPMFIISPQRQAAWALLQEVRHQKEQRIWSARCALNNSNFKNLAAAAVQQDIPYKTLYNCKHGRSSHSEAFEDLLVLPPVAEEVSLQHIHS